MSDDPSPPYQLVLQQHTGVRVYEMIAQSRDFPALLELAEQARRLGYQLVSLERSEAL